jgi:hypothetical protein
MVIIMMREYNKRRYSSTIRELSEFVLATKYSKNVNHEMGWEFSNIVIRTSLKQFLSPDLRGRNNLEHISLLRWILWGELAFHNDYTIRAMWPNIISVLLYKCKKIISLLISRSPNPYDHLLLRLAYFCPEYPNVWNHQTYLPIFQRAEF